MSESTPRSDALQMLSKLSASLDVPLAAGIEISDRCNEVCVHCYQVQGLKGEMSTAQLRTVLDELADMGVLLLTIAGGEPTLRHDFLEILAHARSRGFALRIFTNGTTMTRELAQRLSELAVHKVEISLYSTRAEVHDFVTGLPGSFARSSAAVRYLAEAGVPVTIKTPLMAFNESEAADYERFARELGADFAFDPGELMPREGGDRSPEAYNPSERARVGVIRRYAAQCETNEVGEVRPQAPCGAGQQIHIEPNGELRPCTMLEFDLGHTLNEGTADAYRNNVRRRQLLALSWTDLHGCRECALQSDCAHCYAAALVDAADALGPYRGGCASARSGYAARTGSDPKIVATQGRDEALGPYSEIAPGVFETAPDIVTPADDELATKLGWTRRPKDEISAQPLAVRPGELIQIRRPGRKSFRLERVPGGLGDRDEAGEDSSSRASGEPLHR